MDAIIQLGSIITSGKILDFVVVILIFIVFLIGLYYRFWFFPTHKDIGRLDDKVQCAIKGLEQKIDIQYKSLNSKIGMIFDIVNSKLK